MSSQLESLKYLPGLQREVGTLWNDYDKILVILDKLSVKNLNYLHELA